MTADGRRQEEFYARRNEGLSAVLPSNMRDDESATYYGHALDLVADEMARAPNADELYDRRWKMIAIIRHAALFKRHGMATTMTITEALAELKTIQKRIGKKREYILPYLWRQEGLKDPLEKDGGSTEVIKRETQAIGDLEKRIIAIRTAIQTVNLATPLTVGDTTKTIAEWLTWRKEVAEGSRKFVDQMRQLIQQARTGARQKGYSVLPAGATPTGPLDVIVNVDESDLAKLAESYETILGTLDGQLSLKNATVMITLPE